MPYEVNQFWEFTLAIAIEKQTALHFEEKNLKPIDFLVQEQLCTINNKFNVPNVFNSKFNFRAEHIYTFDGSIDSEINKPHPNEDYLIIIDGFSTSNIGGGWFGPPNNTIYHKWKWDDWGGPFDEMAIDGLTHELGHARGAIDIYALKVEDKKNEVNQSSFIPINSIMNYPYGNTIWDQHSINIINLTSNRVIKNADYITSAFPKEIQLVCRGQANQPLKGVTVKLFPVYWSKDAVSSSFFYQYETNAYGIILLTENPFKPGSISESWDMPFCNFLVEATYKSMTQYQWLPLYEIQNSYFENGKDSIYSITFILE